MSADNAMDLPEERAVGEPQADDRVILEVLQTAEIPAKNTFAQTEADVDRGKLRNIDDTAAGRRQEIADLRGTSRNQAEEKFTSSLK